MIKFHILDEEKNVVPAEELQWDHWFFTADRQVKLTYIAGMCVSTIFMGFHTTLFETLVFGEADDTYGKRKCSTWIEAESQHDALVEEITKTL